VPEPHAIRSAQVRDVAEQIHTLTSCRVFKEGYPDKPPNWVVWGAEFEGDHEDWEQGWRLVEEDEWFHEPMVKDDDDKNQDGDDKNQDGEPLALSPSPPTHSTSSAGVHDAACPFSCA
jgi:hypothetical protein